MVHLKSLSDTLTLCYFECMFMWYEHHDIRCGTNVNLGGMKIGGTKRRWYEKPDYHHGMFPHQSHSITLFKWLFFS